MTRHALAALILMTLAACAPRGPIAVALAPRAAEAIDPRAPLPPPAQPGPASAAVTAEVARLRRAGLATVAPFDAAMIEAVAATVNAGPAQSESWIEAQQRLSAAQALRAPLTAALAELDALQARQIAESGGVARGDRVAIEAASAELGAIDRDQAARARTIAARLGS